MKISATSRTPSSSDTVTSRYTVEYQHNGITHSAEGNRIVLATPAYAASNIVHSFSSSTAHALSSIHYAPVVSLFLGMRRQDVPHPLNGFGFLVPSVERRNLLGCLWSSSLFPNRAPHGMVGMTVFLGGSRQPELIERDQEQLVHLALEELKSIMQITGKPVYWRVTVWQRAIPQYEIGYAKILAQLDQFEERHEGLTLCSNYRGGISVGDCIKSAHEVAERIIRAVRT
jgi:oxygen-dependent protoporphyrinogen oxidase